MIESELSDIIQDLDLSQENAEFLGSRLQQWVLKRNDVYKSHVQNTSTRSASLKKNYLLFSCDINGLIKSWEKFIWNPVIYYNRQRLNTQLTAHLKSTPTWKWPSRPNFLMFQDMLWFSNGICSNITVQLLWKSCINVISHIYLKNMNI